MIWLNGELLHPAEARIDPSDRGLLLGDGLFETIRLHNAQPQHMPRHLARMAAGAALLSLQSPWTHAQIERAIAALIAHHPAAGSIRITLTRGPAPRGVLPTRTRPTLLIVAHPTHEPPKQVSVIVSRTTRRNEHSPLSRIKSTNYLDAIMARMEAAEAGADDAILLNTAGNLAEATSSNLFIRRGNTLLTPRVTDGALPGIARALLMEAGAMEITLTEQDLYAADAIILTNSLGSSEARFAFTLPPPEPTGGAGARNAARRRTHPSPPPLK